LMRATMLNVFHKAAAYDRGAFTGLAEEGADAPD